MASTPRRFAASRAGSEAFAHDDDLDLRVNIPQRPDRGRAIHERHHHVGQHESDVRPAGGKEGNGLRAVGGGQHLVAVPFENLPGHEAHRILVFHQQNGFAAASGGGWNRGFLRRGDGRCGGRQIDFELRPQADLADHIQESAVAFDDAQHRR